MNTMLDALQKLNTHIKKQASKSAGKKQQILVQAWLEIQPDGRVALLRGFVRPAKESTVEKIAKQKKPVTEYNVEKAGEVVF